jgi:hypothetical protein
MPLSNGGSKGKGRPPLHPDLEELLKRSQDKLKQVMPGGTGLPGSLLFLITVAIAAIIAFYAFTFRVDPDELGVVMLFGKPVRTEPPGLHFRLPYPIEEVRLPKVTRQNIIDIGMRSSEVERGVRPVPEESLMLTGDENIVDINFVVFWRIKDAQKYLFNIQKPDVTVKEVAESAMRDIVGQSNIQPLLTGARQKTEQAVQKLSSRCNRADRPLPTDLRGVQESALGNPQAHVSGDHGARPGRHGQDHPRQQGGTDCRAVPIPRPAAQAVVHNLPQTHASAWDTRDRAACGLRFLRQTTGRYTMPLFARLATTTTFDDEHL